MRVLTAAATVALFAFAATPALAVDLKVEKTVAVQASAVWTAIGDFCGLSAWHPAIEKCELSTVKKREVRTIAVKGGGTIVERLDARDAEGMAYTYTIVSSPLPVTHYSAKLSVAPTKDGAGAVITWRSHFDPVKGKTKAEATDAIRGIYQAGLDGLAAQAVKVTVK